MMDVVGQDATRTPFPICAFACHSLVQMLCNPNPKQVTPILEGPSPYMYISGYFIQSYSKPPYNNHYPYTPRRSLSFSEFNGDVL